MNIINYIWKLFANFLLLKNYKGLDSLRLRYQSHCKNSVSQGKRLIILTFFTFFATFHFQKYLFAATFKKFQEQNVVLKSKMH